MILNEKWKHLPLDTKYFKDLELEILSLFDDLDEALDGLLIKSENWQALNLLADKYREKIKCIYIDPPYNTGNDGFLYRDRYQHSFWLSMMWDRLWISKEILKNDGTIFISIDDNEFGYLKEIVRIIFGEVLEIFKIKVRHEKRILREDIPFQRVIEYVVLTRKTKLFKPLKIKNDEEEALSEYIYQIKELSPPEQIEVIGGYEVQIFKPGQYQLIQLKPSRNNLKRYTIRGSLITQKGSASEFYELYLRERRHTDGLGTLYKVMGMGTKGDGLGYRWIQQPTSHNIRNGIYFQGYPLKIKVGKPLPDFYDFVQEFNFASEEGGISFKNGKKPTAFITQLFFIGKVVIERTSLILDFFAGSGTTAHAVIKLNAEDGGKRKFILVEMADYFYTVMVPRIKKVAYSLNWKKGKPQDGKGPGVFFKYFELEQFEDALGNVIFNMDRLIKEEHHA